MNAIRKTTKRVYHFTFRRTSEDATALTEGDEARCKQYRCRYVNIRSALLRNINMKINELGGGWINHSFINVVITFFHFFISAATGAAAPGCIGTVNATD